MYYLFIDESGDHSLKSINADFPVFVLCGVLIESKEYLIIDQKVKDLKKSIWDDKKVIFHSTDIRKKRNEFVKLIDEGIYKQFLHGLNTIMSESKYTVIASCVDKDKFVKAYGKLVTNAYSVCLSFIIERTVFFLDDVPADLRKLQICIEGRGKKEDGSLRSDFDKVCARGTTYVNAKRIKDIGADIHFRLKKDDITGLQISDLVAYPIARYILDKSRANPAFDIIQPKLYAKGKKVYGLKFSP